MPELEADLRLAKLSRGLSYVFTARCTEVLEPEVFVPVKRNLLHPMTKGTDTQENSFEAGECVASEGRRHGGPEPGTLDIPIAGGTTLAGSFHLDVLGRWYASASTGVRNG